MPFAGLLTVGIISAGAQIYGAHKAASASKDAAKQQVASAEQAKAELAPIHQQNVARMDPYAALGGGALGKLGALSGIAPVPMSGGVSMANAVGRDAQGNPLGPINGSQGPINMSDPRNQHAARGGSMVDFPTMAGSADGMSLSRLGGGGASAYTQSKVTPRQGQAIASAMPALVRMISPDGAEQQDVPAEHVARFEALGARRAS